MIQKLLEKYRIDIFFALIFVGILACAYKDLLSQISTVLMDKYDYPYIVWVVNSNIQNILNGDFSHYFDTRGFYPHPYGLLFSDILLPQSLMVLPLYLLTKNIILSFNSILLFTYFLNYCASYVFWRYFTKNSFLSFIGALLVVFGPFYQIQMAHFQMQSYWLALFGLFFLFKSIDTSSKKMAIIAGICIGIQFLASVYHFVFFASISAIVILVSFFFHKNKSALAQLAGIMYLVMGITIFAFVKAYYAMKAHYGMTREIEEIILYQAHMTDYLFTGAFKSSLYKLQFWSEWNRFDKHIIGEKTVFPGFFLTIFSLWGAFSFMKSKAVYSFQFVMSKWNVIFALVGLVGFIASLGPRLSFNGTYGHIPSPYLVGLKLFPMIDAIRSPARWSVLLYIALVYFSLIGIQKAYSRMSGKLSPLQIKLLCVGLFIWVWFEYVPTQLTVAPLQPVTHEYKILEQKCQDTDLVLAEYPVTHFTAFGGIVEGLSYISAVQLAQVSHNCPLMNGYSGFIPQEVFKTETDLNALVAQGNADALQKYMDDHEIDVIKLNGKNVLPEYRSGYSKLITALQNDTDFLQLSPMLFQIRSVEK